VLLVNPADAGPLRVAFGRFTERVGLEISRDPENVGQFD